MRLSSRLLPALICASFVVPSLSLSVVGIDIDRVIFKAVGFFFGGD